MALPSPAFRSIIALDSASDLPRTGRPDPEAPDAAYLRCWGTRGSIPSPGSNTVRHGGNTTCVEVTDGDTRLIFDAGSGIRPMGVDVFEKGPNRIHIFLTHFHWDHIQGFPFFRPLYDPDDTIHVVGPKQKDIDVQNLFAGQMGPIYFPVPFSVKARLFMADKVSCPFSPNTRVRYARILRWIVSASPSRPSWLSMPPRVWSGPITSGESFP